MYEQIFLHNDVFFHFWYCKFDKITAMDNGQKYKQKIEKTVPLENVYAFERNILNVLGYSNIASLLISM